MNDQGAHNTNGLSAEEVMEHLNSAHALAPLPRAYWVTHPLMLGGVYPGATDPTQCRDKLHRLVDAGVRTFINLMEEQEFGHDGAPIRPYEAMLADIARESGASLTMRRIPVRDVSVPSHHVMKTILDAIDDEHRANRPVYVHCWGGRGRTGTVVGCWLARHGYATGEQALRVIELLRREVWDNAMPSPETTEQVEMAMVWEGDQ